MRQRVDNLVGFGAESVWVSTFHSACVRILRRFIDRLGYENFKGFDYQKLSAAAIVLCLIMIVVIGILLWADNRVGRDIEE